MPAPRAKGTVGRSLALWRYRRHEHNPRLRRTRVEHPERLRARLVETEQVAHPGHPRRRAGARHRAAAIAGEVQDIDPPARPLDRNTRRRRPRRLLRMWKPPARPALLQFPDSPHRARSRKRTTPVPRVSTTAPSVPPGAKATNAGPAVSMSSRFSPDIPSRRTSPMLPNKQIRGIIADCQRQPPDHGRVACVRRQFYAAARARDSPAGL